MKNQIVALAALLCVACSGDQEPQQTQAPAAQTPAIGPQPVPEPTTFPEAMAAVEVEGLVVKGGPAGMKYELGKKLFFDPRLSASGKTSCNSCHYPELGWTDGRQFSPKDDGKPNKRHTPTLLNTGYLSELYWDGRAQGMEKNVLAAWKGQMGGDPAAVAKTLAAIPEYRERFEAIFKTGPDEASIVKSLAMFVQMQKGQGAAFDRWQAGDENAVSQDAKAGYDLFLGKAGCAICHTPPLFMDKSFHNVGIGMAATEPDLGRGAHLKDPRFNGCFKTPTLRDVAKSAPYFHDGSVATLEEAVRLMASGGLPADNKDPALLDRKLSDEEIKALVAFLETLSTDQTFEKPTLPD